MVGNCPSFSAGMTALDFAQSGENVHSATHLLMKNGHLPSGWANKLNPVFSDRKVNGKCTNDRIATFGGFVRLELARPTLNPVKLLVFLRTL